MNDNEKPPVQQEEELQERMARAGLVTPNVAPRKLASVAPLVGLPKRAPPAQAVQPNDVIYYAMRAVASTGKTQALHFMVADQHGKPQQVTLVIMPSPPAGQDSIEVDVEVPPQIKDQVVTGQERKGS